MPAAPAVFERYGDEWRDVSEIDVEIWMIQQGEDYLKKQGRSLFFHYRELQSLLWPDDDHHEWSDLMLKTILENRITVVQGGKDSSKTHTMAKFGLTDYFCFPNTTLILLSSTDVRGLELRVWGDLKDLFKRAKEVWPECPGCAVDSLHGIFTDEIGDTVQVRDMRKGMICIPCLESGGQWKGLEKYTGIKQKRRRLLGDEVQFMQLPYLSSLANLNKGEFKGVFVGNPIGENDPLDKLAEPITGWDNLLEISTTTTWPNAFGGTTINLVGMDSPAIRHPGKYTYLIDQSDIDYIVSYWGKDSSEFWNQAAGVRRPGVSLCRIVTREMVVKFGAQDDVVWRGETTTKVYAIDAGYGGDRCVGGEAEFGTDINGNQVLLLGRPRVIPVKVYPKSTPESDRVLPEDQIAEYVKADCERLGIPAANVFHDSTGRGSLGSAFARLWRHDCNPVEFGGSPTPRPVMSDLFIYDEKLKKKRLKRCDEHYSKRVSELHFSVRYAIEARQIRGLTNEVRDELCAREWGRTRLDRIEVETKEDTKKRLGRSPDLGDHCAILVEGARQLGFQIARLQSEESSEEDQTWRLDLVLKARQLRESYTLSR
jgi:hypothetical protein